jgi:membrane protein
MGGRWSDRLAAVVGWGPVATLRRVLDRYEAAGGGLLAGGLAYSALFAIVPLLVLLAGILGLVVSDTDRRLAVVAAITDVLPPLRDLVRLVLEEAAGAAGAISIIGAVALAWGASRFVVAFEDAVRRVFGGTSRRSFVLTNAIGLAAVLALVGASVVGALVAALGSYLQLAEGRGILVVGFLENVLLAIVPLLLAAGALVLVFRFVPFLPPAWRAILPPALVTALAIDLLTRAFIFLAPRLIGAVATIGALATAFAALAWMGLTFQAVLLGSAWVRERDRTWGAPPVAMGSLPLEPPEPARLPPKRTDSADL